MSRRAAKIFGIFGTIVFSACGGSSSETPFPLEPDLVEARGGPPARARYVVVTERQRDSERSEPQDSTEASGAEAPSTWGGSEGAGD